jgi:cell division protein FtsB
MQQRPTRRSTTQTAQARAELDMLTAQRAELQGQLQQLAGRRDQLFAQSHTTPDGRARGELESRMAEIDARSAKIDGQIQGLNDRIVEAMSRVGSPTQVIVDVPRVNVPQISIPPFEGIGFRQRGPDMRQMGGMMAAEAFVLAAIGLVFWRMSVRRMRDQFDRMFAQQSTQMSQLQQAVDVIGIEVERISEGQRYVAKMVTDGSAAGATPQGARGEAKAPLSRRDF